MKHIDWYFDFISPYAWLQSTRLDALSEKATLSCKPILFAGLLKHWGQKGPAEMETKRTWTYQQIAWQAHQHGQTLRWPARHPFNPLPLLRLCALRGSDAATVQRLFAWVWSEGHLPDEAGPWSALLTELGVKAEDLDSAQVKDLIRHNTEEALSRGLFGVPSAIVLDEASAPARQSQIFWGFDSTPMLEAWLDGHSYFQSPEYLGVGQVG